VAPSAAKRPAPGAVYLCLLVLGVSPACADSGSSPGGTAGTGGNACVIDFDVSISEQIPTVGIVEWSTDVEGFDRARIEFGLDGSYGMVAPVGLDEPRHRTLLLGMKAERTYHARIVVESEGGVCQSQEFTLTTGPLPNGLPSVSRMLEPANGAPSDGYLISCFVLGGPVFILDRDGDYVWWFGSGDMGRAELSRDGKWLWYAGVNLLGGSGAMRRVTLDGLTHEDLSDEFGDIHHDFTVLPDETIAYIEHDGKRDRVVERAPDGSRREVFDVASAHGGTTDNHANSIRYFAGDDSYTVSDLAQGAYTKVTRRGDVVWVLGGSTSDFTGSGALWEGGQHGHQPLGRDRLLFFNNRTNQMGNSLAIEVTLDLSAMSASRVWEYDGGERTNIYGDVQRLQHGNTLVTYSGTGALHEVNPRGELVQAISWNLGGAIGYATKRSSLYGGSD
jgi:hypothetical protein